MPLSSELPSRIRSEYLFGFAGKLFIRFLIGGQRQVAHQSLAADARVGRDGAAARAIDRRRGYRRDEASGKRWPKVHAGQGLDERRDDLPLKPGPYWRTSLRTPQRAVDMEIGGDYKICQLAEPMSYSVFVMTVPGHRGIRASSRSYYEQHPIPTGVPYTLSS